MIKFCGMLCDLIFKAKNFDVDSTAAMLTIVPYSIWRQGEHSSRRDARKTFSESGLSFTASDADLDSFKQQVAEVISFIKANRQDLLILRDLNNCLEEATLNFHFGITTRLFTVGVQVDFSPAELITLCAEIGAGIIMSQYPPSTDEEDTDANGMN